MSKTTAIGPEATNGAARTIDLSRPYMVKIVIAGVADLICHRWNCEAVEAKGSAAKGSKAKKSDDVESYVYRLDDGGIAIPGEYVRQAIKHAAKFKQDPRSPRKSAMDLFKAGVIALTPLAPLGASAWDYEHRCRVVVQGNAITRVRPAFVKGWSAEFDFAVILPEYISPDLLQSVLVDAGRLIGIGDNRPTYGRFRVTRFEALSGDAL